MATYAMSDLHLSFGVNKPMDVFGEIWKDHDKKIKKNWESTVKNDDLVLIPGDISWGMTYKEALPDFKYINELPGKKIFLRGNHDYYFSTKAKMDKFLEGNNLTTLKMLHNNAYDTEDYIVCGTRGWGATEESDKKLDKKIIAREELRLKLSLDEAMKIKREYDEKNIEKRVLVAMHFPPFVGNFQKILEEYGVYMCIYGHLHGYGHMFVKEGNINGVEYKMVSCDYNKFKMVKL